MRAWWGVARLASLLLLAGEARADSSGASRVLLLFSISKSENKNQVQYAVRVDDHCRPLAGAPVFAYWRMLEKGPAVTEPLLAHEQDAYGIASQVTTQMPESAAVHLVLRAVRTRPITVEVFRSAAGSCQALATATILGAPAHLFDVYVKLKWPFGVESLLLQGWSLDGARVLKETLAE